MINFYTTKVAYQWTNGGFDAIGAGISFAFGDKKSLWVQNILNGPAHIFFSFIANWHQCVVYFAFLLSMLHTLTNIMRRGRSYLHAEMFLTVIIIGGFLFELIWESAARYVLMYYTMMLPLAATSIARVYESLMKRTNRSTSALH